MVSNSNGSLTIFFLSEKEKEKKEVNKALERRVTFGINLGAIFIMLGPGTVVLGGDQLYPNIYY
jgi:hypothetical protein